MKEKTYKIKCMNKECNNKINFKPKEIFTFCTKHNQKYQKALKETEIWIKENENEIKEIFNI